MRNTECLGTFKSDPRQLTQWLCCQSQHATCMVVQRWRHSGHRLPGVDPHACAIPHGQESGRAEGAFSRIYWRDAVTWPWAGVQGDWHVRWESRNRAVTWRAISPCTLRLTQTWSHPPRQWSLAYMCTWKLPFEVQRTQVYATGGLWKTQISVLDTVTTLILVPCTHMICVTRRIICC